MDRCFREREFDYRIAAGVLISGTVSGKILPEEPHMPSEIADLKINARVYTHILDDVGVPFDGFEMSEEMRKTVEAFAADVLFEEEAA